MTVLIIEFIFSAVIGAIFFRLMWAITKNNWITWLVTLLIAIGLWVFLPVGIEQDVLYEFSGKREISLPCGFCFELNRFLGWWCGVVIAALIITKRRKMGLEDDIPYKDFP